MKMLEFYESILKTAGLSVGDDHLLYFKDNPFEVDDKPLVFPIKAALRDRSLHDNLKFHPLQENILSGESESFKAYRECLVDYINVCGLSQMIGLIELSLDVKSHSKLKAELGKILEPLKDADKQTLEFVDELSKISMSNPEYALFNVYVKRLGYYEGNKYLRVGILNHPLLQAMSEDKTYYLPNGSRKGLKLRRKDVAIIRYLLKLFVVGDANEDGEYETLVPCKCKTSPSLEVLLKSLVIPIECINHISDLLGNGQQLDVEWAEVIEDLDVFKSELALIPSQHQGAPVLEVKEEPKLVQPKDEPIQYRQVTQAPPPQVEEDQPRYRTIGGQDPNARVHPQQVQQEPEPELTQDDVARRFGLGGSRNMGAYHQSVQAAHSPYPQQGYQPYPQPQRYGYQQQQAFQPPQEFVPGAQQYGNPRVQRFNQPAYPQQPQYQQQPPYQQPQYQQPTYQAPPPPPRPQPGVYVDNNGMQFEIDQWGQRRDIGYVNQPNQQQGKRGWFP